MRKFAFSSELLVGCRFTPKATLRPIIVMSALPPKADMCSAQADVRFVPKADIMPNVFG